MAVREIVKVTILFFGQGESYLGQEKVGEF